mgnify:CR=1 FL=1
MAAFNFPNSPSTNDLHTENNVTWKWNGTVWKRVNNSYLTASTLNVSGISTFVGNAQFSTLSGSGVLVYSTGSGVLDDNVNHSISGNTLNTVDLEAQGNITVADKIIHRSDTDTAMRFPAADTITAETAGSERIRIKSNGFVGIGTDNPTRVVHVQDDSNTLLALDSTDSNADLVQSDTGGSTRIRSVSGALEFFAGGNASSTNATGSVKRLLIAADSNITQTIDTDGDGFIITAGDMKPMLTGNSNRSAHNNLSLIHI